MVFDACSVVGLLVHVWRIMVSWVSKMVIRMQVMFFEIVSLHRGSHVGTCAFPSRTEHGYIVCISSQAIRNRVIALEEYGLGSIVCLSGRLHTYFDLGLCLADVSKLAGRCLLRIFMFKYPCIGWYPLATEVGTV